MTATIATDAPTAAETLIGRDYLSYSAMNTYRRCPLQFYFRYVEQLPQEIVSASLVFGRAIHEAVEFHFREILAGNPPPNRDMLLDVYQEAWRSEQAAEIQFAKSDDQDKLGHLADRVLTAFQDSDFAEPAGSILGVEEELRGDIVPGCPDILARLDLMTVEGDDLVVTDLKTAKSRWSQGQVDDSADQLLLYSELAQGLLPGKNLRLQFGVVTKTKQPVVALHEVKVNPHLVERTKRIVQRVWRSIESGNFYPNPSPMNCSTCPFRGACRAWSG